MIELTGELYPSLRWFLFDGLQRFAAPVTVFGPIRAALYLGQMYLVLSSAEHVRELTIHFDDHIRLRRCSRPTSRHSSPGFADDLARQTGLTDWADGKIRSQPTAGVVQW